MVQQEKITDKWKGEHAKTVGYFEKTLKHLEVENRMLKDKVIQLKASVSVMREEKHGSRAAPSHDEKPSRERTRSKERESRSKDRSKTKWAILWKLKREWIK